nr:uncharacterized protein LOC110362310 isoform X8 [Columba livia]
MLPPRAAPGRRPRLPRRRGRWQKMELCTGNPGRGFCCPVISVLHKKREDEIADKGRLDSGCISAVTALLRRDVEAEELLPIAASPRGLVNSVNASCSIAFLLAAVAIFLDLQTPSSITERLCRCRDFLCFPSW